VNLKKLIIVEAGAVILVLIVALTLVEVIPNLASSQQNSSIGMYNEKTFAEGNVTLARGTIVQSSKFNYTTFDPAILVLELNFQTWRSPGNLTINVNGNSFATINATPEKPHVKLTAITCSGKDLVEPLSKYSPFVGNTIFF
jgi:hypothetical protein